MPHRPKPDRRATARRYDALLPEYFPVRLLDSAIAVDFLVGGGAAAGQAEEALDARVSPRRMLAWLRSMPAYGAGVPVRLGHQADAGRTFEKAAALLDLLDPARPVTWVTRRPFAPAERAFLAAPRPNLLLELTAAPTGAEPGGPDPLALVRAAAGLDPRAVHWVIGPLRDGDEAEATSVLAALPAGSRLTLRPGGGAAGDRPLGPEPLARLEAAAHARGLTVTDWSCRGGLARLGRGLPEVDRITGQADLARRAHDLITCAACPSRTVCHGPLDEPALLARLERELKVPGLTLLAPPVRTGPRALRVEVAEPTAPGDQAYLSHALAQPVAVTLSTCQAAAGRRADAAVLRRWYAAGFLPVSELNAVAEKVLEDLARRAAAAVGDGQPARGAGARG